ncbi:MAG: hypothetical protein JO115_12155 [Pseudonocardiales bacterium]|nr:hypothetical protein [Pseudonocardiales bacterium]
MRRTEAEPGEPNPPRTLAQASEVVWSLRPVEQARLADWVTSYQRSAVIYDRIAATDHSHHKTVHLAGHAHERARDLETRIPRTRQHP